PDRAVKPRAKPRRLEKTDETASDPARTYTAEELAALVGISPRVLFYWQQKGLIPAPLRGKRGGGYGREHLLRARASRLLRAQFEFLADIAAALEGKSLDDLAALVDPPPPLSEPPPAPPPRPAEP